MIATYEVSLGDPGKEGLWETGDVIGIGRVPAMAVNARGRLSTWKLARAWHRYGTDRGWFRTADEVAATF